MKHLLLLFVLLCFYRLQAQELYTMSGQQTRWSSFENPQALPGKGGTANKTAKGHAFEILEPGATLTLLNVAGAGIIQRIWLTFRERSPEILRSLRLEMFWDGESTPAVAVPIGDFFSIAHGQTMPFENALFSSPEGRSFNCYIPMPFRKGARITVTNDGTKRIDLFFYDVNFQSMKTVPADALYFHCHWRRELKTVLGSDFELLPAVEGRGRLLGVNLGVITAPQYGKSWWGEGEVKMYIDGDHTLPTINGTGTEDYVGSGWGLGKFFNRLQGCSVANDSAGYWSIYRFHIDDAVYFQKKIKATIQVIGGNMLNEVRNMEKAGVKIIPVTVNDNQLGCIKLLEGHYPPLQDPAFPNGWVNFYRSEDYCATAYFYLDKPSSKLAALPALAIRLEGIH